MSAALAERVRDALRGVVDPEMPVVSVVDLGLVEAVEADADGRVRVVLLPTFSGCPALGLIRADAAAAVAAVPGVSEVAVDFAYDPPWTPERVTEAGRRALAGLGVAVRATPASPTRCPRCGAAAPERSAFGPTRCRAVAYCDACREPFEVMRPLSLSVR